ncbi:MAG TPA: hybrid sensor histidine kinase/response regulator [Azospirillaceae bacterium]|nr:hybrid sensor histidine kinase/response regulator [Azospirillaceae bacterium]
MHPGLRSPTLDGTTILVVDDSRTNLLFVTDLLRQAGYRSVHGVTDPREAVAQVRALQPDVLILDYVMPHLDGIGVIDALNASGLEVRPAIIMLTGKAERELRIAALERGARDFVNKPCDKHELLARVANTAQVQFLQRQLQQQNTLLEGMVAERTQRLQEAIDVLRQAERRLADALERSERENRDKSEFLANAAHELRTPLNAIIGFSEMIRDQVYGPLGDRRYGEFAGDIHQAGTHLLALVEGTLDLAKAESGRTQLEVRETDVGRVVADSVRMLRTMADGSGVKLTLRVPDEPLTIRTDPEKIRQIVLNLASNAIKFTPKGGQVSVEVAPGPGDGALIMVVRDTGVGIAPEDMATALRPFGQVRAAVQRPGQKGTGLGLPLTRRFVEMLGGTLDIASEVGRGTVVTVRLPADIGADADHRAAAVG